MPEISMFLWNYPQIPANLKNRKRSGAVYQNSTGSEVVAKLPYRPIVIIYWGREPLP